MRLVPDCDNLLYLINYRDDFLSDKRNGKKIRLFTQVRDFIESLNILGIRVVNLREQDIESHGLVPPKEFMNYITRRINPDYFGGKYSSLNNRTSERRAKLAYAK